MNTPENLPNPLIPLNTLEANIESVGGKGANLVRLVNAGYPVPEGFLIPTMVYRNFIQHNGLETWLQRALKGLDPTSPEALATASDTIRDRFYRGEIPQPLPSSLEIGLRWLDAGPVAVRSSATAEDLPELSFAGQQDTFLNVVGADALMEAVVRCWSSLWTARAIGYRARNNIPHEDVSISVVVQNMVPSEASGVLFTANPLTGLRSETVIDATLGLGEALVSGQVEPDHYVVDIPTGSITNKSLGSKAMVIEGATGGGVTSREGDSSHEQAIPDEAILHLAEIGAQIEALFGTPQDIEWAWVRGEIFVLQSRPITSLFPVPEGMGPDSLQAFFSFGAVQGLLDPITPLGKDAIRFIFAGGASLFGFDLNHETQGVIKFAGGRLWGNLTSIARHPIGVKVIPRVFPGIEPGSVQALKQILADPRIQAGSGRYRFSTFWRLARFAARMMKRILPFAHRPEESAVQILQQYQAKIVKLGESVRAQTGGTPPLAEIIKLYRSEMYNAFVYAVPEIAAGVLVGLLPLLLLNKFSNHLTGSGEHALGITRGLPNNVTTEMDLILWETARTIRKDPMARDHMVDTTIEDLAEQYLQNRLPETAQQAIARFLDRYGMRGLGEIDMGRPRWQENPVPIMQTMKSYLQIEDGNMAPDVVFSRSEQSAQESAAMLERAARDTTCGGVKAKIIRAAIRRVRALAGLRESPKFYIIQVMNVLRQGLLDNGKELVGEGKLERSDDLFYLYFNELEDFVKGEQRDWKAVVAERRREFNHEMRRRQIPRLLLSDGRAFYEGMTTSEDEQGAWRGSPVSPGIVEGYVRVVLDPHHAGLSPGEILVCPATDPSWTPLFLAAGGLVMETGGLMTHGAIVAREYGIPAVVGVDRATELLQTGDRIKVDGNTGRIEKV